jgi:uncharacterized ferredoxin-like protein
VEKVVISSFELHGKIRGRKQSKAAGVEEVVVVVEEEEEEKKEQEELEKLATENVCSEQRRTKEHQKK